MTAPTAPKVFNIPSGLPFADALASVLLARTAGNPLELAEYLLLLPSRRACRAMADAFLRNSQGRPLLLPDMRPIGDVDADDISVFATAEGELPPAISKLERQLLLARLIQQADNERSFDQSLSMALKLAQFLDEVQTERLSFDDLQKIVPDEFAGHWQQTLDFLKILTMHWPSILGEQGLVDIAERRNLLIEAQVKAWESMPPTGKVLAAGSVGPIPAVAEMLVAVAKLPQGEIVLPGVDMKLDDESWSKLDEEHPQYLIKKLMTRIGVTRSDIIQWQGDDVAQFNQDRVKLLSEAMRPAETTDKWRELKVDDIAEHALAGLSLINCPTAQQEADIIALIMRQTLNEPAKTCALVTADRNLARRVSQSLLRWNIKVDDSGGQPLSEFPVGSFMMMLADTALENLTPVKLLALLKHPMTALGMDGAALRDNVQWLDENVLRGPRHSGGVEGLMAQAEQNADKSFMEWLERLQNIMQAFVSMMSVDKEYGFIELLEAHIKTAEMMAQTVDISGDKRLWRGEAGEAAAEFLRNLRPLAGIVPHVKPEHYVSIFRILLKGNIVRPRFGTHQRLSILGQIEARMQSADIVVLGGLNEGTWPKLPGDDPWMSRPMRRQFGLPAPEKEIGLSAHDFSQLAVAREVVLTRAEKVDGTPTVPARWLLRMETVLKQLGMKFNNRDEAQYRHWLKMLDRADKVVPTERPSPCPSASARPLELSVTNIEKLMFDPYQIYAKYILRLKALHEIDEDAGGAEKGLFIHSALERFVKDNVDVAAPNAKDKLLQFGRASLADLHIADDVQAYWWPRFEKVAEMFIEEEKKRRQSAVPFATETTGKIKLANGFTLTAKADRIDKLAAGGYAIIDYKSGTKPSNPDVVSGLKPQLPLEGIILQEGGFIGVEAGKVEDLVYWRVNGSGVKPVEIKSIDHKPDDIATLLDNAKEGVTKLTDYFASEDAPYISSPRQDKKSAQNDYEHLSRIREWGILGEEGSE